MRMWVIESVRKSCPIPSPVHHILHNKPREEEAESSGHVGDGSVDLCLLGAPFIGSGLASVSGPQFRAETLPRPAGRMCATPGKKLLAVDALEITVHTTSAQAFADFASQWAAL